MEIRCLLNTVYKPNIQNGIARCNKTLNNYVTKAGVKFSEVICDYGRDLVSKSEVYSNKIINTLTNGDVITYTKNPFGEVFVKEGSEESISKNPEMWDNLMKHIYKGL